MWEKRASWSGLGERSLPGEAYAAMPANYISYVICLRNQQVGVGNLATFCYRLLRYTSIGDLLDRNEVKVRTRTH